MTECYIGLGSNVGDREKNIFKAIELIKREEKVISLSHLIETKPQYYQNQREFLNGAVLIDTNKSAKELLNFIQTIENKLKRKRLVKYGPRTLDLDIIFYGNEIINEENLIIPHPNMQERAFVLKPLAKINPDFVHPLIKKTIKELLKDLRNKTNKI